MSEPIDMMPIDECMDCGTKEEVHLWDNVIAGEPLCLPCASRVTSSDSKHRSDCPACEEADA